MARADDEDLPFFVTQLGKLAGERAVSTLLELYARAPLQAAIKQAFTQTRPDARAELEAALDGANAKAATALLKELPEDA